MDYVTHMHSYTHICYLYAWSASFCTGLISGKLVEFFFMFLISDCNSHNTAVMDLFVSHVSICSTMAFIALGNSDHVVVSKNNRGLPSFIVSSILVLIRTVLGVIWEMFHRKISLNSVLLLLLVNFVSGLMLEWTYASLIVTSSQALPFFCL